MQLAAPQPLPDFHQNLAEAVQAGAIATIPPVRIFGGVLDDSGITGCQQQISEVGVLGELRKHGFAHQIIFHRFPIRAQWPLPRSAHPCGNHRGAGQADGFFVLGSGELLCLKVMLGGGPYLALERDRVGGEVGEFAVGVADGVEKYIGHSDDCMRLWEGVESRGSLIGGVVSGQSSVVSKRQQRQINAKTAKLREMA